MNKALRTSKRRILINACTRNPFHISGRGLTSTQWTEYSAGTKRLQYSTVLTSSITAETVTVSGVVLSQKDTSGITTAATRPLAIQKDGFWFTYGCDLTKNICGLYGPSGYIRAAYTYFPYGQVTSTGDVEQTIQWSSEYNDTELGMVYYNYRHYNPTDGRWTGRDKVEVGENYKNKYIFASNRIFETVDHLGNYHL